MGNIRILLADDQTLMRDSLKTIIDLESDMKVVATAVNGLEAVNLAMALQPDVILMDIRMPEMDGVESVRIIKEKYPQVRIIMLTTFNEDEYIIDALAAGACGYLLKDTEVEKLLEAVRDAVNDKMVIPPAVAAKLAQGLAKLNTSKKDSISCDKSMLSERELEIAAMLVHGFTNKQISTALYISEGTVRNYISGIYGKLGVNDRTNAVIYLKEHGIL